MEEVTQEILKENFPHGVLVFLGEDRPVIEVIDLGIIKDEDSVYAVGYAYPNKDFVFDVTRPKEDNEGWWVRTADGVPCFWSPLSAESERVTRARMEEI